MELRWLDREVPIGRNTVKIETVLQYRVPVRARNGAIINEGEWQDVPTVEEE